MRMREAWTTRSTTTASKKATARAGARGVPTTGVPKGNGPDVRDGRRSRLVYRSHRRYRDGRSPTTPRLQSPQGGERKRRRGCNERRRKCKLHSRRGSPLGQSGARTSALQNMHHCTHAGQQGARGARRGQTATWASSQSGEGLCIAESLKGMLIWRRGAGQCKQRARRATRRGRAARFAQKKQPRHSHKADATASRKTSVARTRFASERNPHDVCPPKSDMSHNLAPNALGAQTRVANVTTY